MNFETISPKEFVLLIDHSNVLIIDLRSRMEYDQYHIKGATSLPYEDKKHWENYLPRNKTLVFYCERGSTSMKMAKELSERNINAKTVIGGIHSIMELRTLNPEYIVN